MVAYVFVIGFLLFALLKLCLGVLLPFIIGTVIAVIVQKPALLLSQKVKIKQGTLALLMVIGVYLILLLLLIFFGSRVYVGLVKIYEKLPEYTESVSSLLEISQEKIEGLFYKFGFKNFSTIGNIAGESLSGLASKTIDVFSDFISTFLKKAPSFVFGLFVTLISGCFIAKDFCAFKKILYFALNDERISVLEKIKKILINNVFKLLKGYMILSLIAFGVLSLGFLIIGIKDAIKIAFITAFIDLLPVFGSGIVLVPWALICLLKGKTVTFVSLLVLYVCLLIVRNAFEPKIVGKQVGLHPLLTLLSLFLGVKFFGVMGIFVLPLIVTVVYKYYEEKVTEKAGAHSM